MEENKITLYSYWRSSSSWRIRLALNYKKIAYEYHAVNLLKSEQLSEEYSKVNPQNLVPALEIDGVVLTESMAILEYLEETHPEPRILPEDAKGRATVRKITQMVVADIQPIQNLKVLKYVGPEKKKEFANHFITVGFEALEKVLATTAGKYCYGDSPTMADFVVIPQVYNAKRYGVDMSRFPTIDRITTDFEKLDFAVASHPSTQPDMNPDAAP